MAEGYVITADGYVDFYTANEDGELEYHEDRSMRGYTFMNGIGVDYVSHDVLYVLTAKRVYHCSGLQFSSPTCTELYEFDDQIVPKDLSFDKDGNGMVIADAHPAEEAGYDGLLYYFRGNQMIAGIAGHDAMLAFPLIGRSVSFHGDVAWLSTATTNFDVAKCTLSTGPVLAFEWECDPWTWNESEVSDKGIVAGIDVDEVGIGWLSFHSGTVYRTNGPANTLEYANHTFEDGTSAISSVGDYLYVTTGEGQALKVCDYTALGIGSCDSADTFASDAEGVSFR